MKALLIILLIACAAFLAWDMRLAEHPLPHRTELIDSNGNAITVDITGASDDTVYFLTTSTPVQSFSHPISELSLMSKYKAMRLQKASAKAGTAQPAQNGSRRLAGNPNAPDTTSTASSNISAQMIKNSLRISELELQITQEQSQQSASSSVISAKERGLRNEIKRLEDENSTLQQRLNRLGSGN